MDAAALLRPRVVVFHPGYDKWRYGEARDRWLAVNPSPEESGTVFMTADQLATLCGGAQVTVKSDGLDGLFRPRREVLALLLALVFVALAAETAGSLLSRRKKEAHGSGA